MNRASALLLGFLLAASSIHARDILVSGRFSNSIVRYDGDTSAFKSVFASGGELQNPNGIAYGPDGNLYAGLGDKGVVLRYDGRTGALIDRFVDTATFEGARGLVFGPDGDLYVAAGSINQVLRFDGKSGAARGNVAVGGNLRGPVGLDIRADGLMAVGGALSNGVYLYRNGQFLRRCFNPANHLTITGVLFGDDGFIYAATADRNSILRVDPETCTQSVFASGQGLDTAIYLEWGPDGNLLAGSFFGDSVIKFDRRNGAGLGTFVTSGSGGLDGTHDIAVMPAEEAFTPSLILPGLARSHGNGGSFFRTSAWVTNPWDEALRLRFTFRPGAGFSLGGAIQPAAMTLAPHAMLAYADVLTDLFHVTDNTGGVLLVEVSDAAHPPVVSARTFNDTDIGTYGQYIEAVPLAHNSGEQWLHGLAADAGSRTNLGIANLENADSHATITLFNGAGIQIGSAIERDLPARTSIQINAVQSVAGVAESSEFSARITCDGCAAFASKLDNITSDPVCVIPNTSRRQQWIDGVGAAPGLGGTMWRSTLSIANKSSEDATVSVAFTRWGDTQPSKLAHLVIAAGHTKFFSDLLPQLFELDGSGSIAMTSNTPVSAWTRTFNDRRTLGTVGQFVPAFGAGELFGETGAILQGLSENDAFRTNAGFINAGSTAVVATVRCFATDGTLLATKTYSVEPGQTVVTGRILADLQVAPIANVHLHVTPSIPGALYAWASSIENASTDQIFIRPHVLP
jgi:hypothetical protein